LLTSYKSAGFRHRTFRKPLPHKDYSYQLSSPRATLGQRKSLINSITQISKPPVQWQNNTITLQWQTKSTQQGGGLTPRMVRAVGLPPGSFPGRCCFDGRGCRSDGRLRRPGSADDSNARRTSPLGDGDSDRDVARLRSGWLSSRSHDDSVGNDPDAGRRTRFPFSSRRTDAPLLRSPHTLQLLPTTATSTSADVPWLPVSSDRADAAPCVLLATALTTLMSPQGTAVPS